jgi:Arc/MetJ-type ribon-helix-helix transcriptional regulator
MSEDSRLLMILRNAEQQVRQLSEESNKDLWKAYALVGNLLYVQVEQGAEEPSEVGESCSNRISLTANMIQSFGALENLISSGAYWSASAVLRQHMETLSRIIEYRQGRNRNDKKPPNVKNIPFNMAPNYGRLSELCHTSGSEILGGFSECSESEGVATTVPRFREDWAKDLFSLHIAHMLSLAIEIYLLQQEVHPSAAIPDINEEVLNVANLLVKTGFWKEFK